MSSERNRISNMMLSLAVRSLARTKPRRQNDSMSLPSTLTNQVVIAPVTLSPCQS
jgi:hypothetical protein